MINGIVAGTLLSALILSPFTLLLAIAVKRSQKIYYNIYNKYSGDCLASGFTCEENAENWLRNHFTEEYSYQSIRGDFIIDKGFETETIFPEDYCFDDAVYEEIKPEDYAPVTPYYKNRITKYFENLK